jgi:hypothetical protein
VIAFFDLEFIQTPLQLASIGIIRADEATLYRVSADYTVPPSQWYFKRKVEKHLKGHPRHPLTWIVAEVERFLRPVSLLVVREGGSDEKLLRQLLPALSIPVLDLNKSWRDRGEPKLPEKPKGHHALRDAEYHRTMFHFLFHEIAA